MRAIELKASRRLGVLLALLAVLAVAAVWLAALPVGVRGLASALVLGAAAWGWRQARPPLRLRLAPDGGLQALDREHGWQRVEVLGDSFVSPGLIVLRYRIADAPPRSLTLLADSAAAEDLRRLRVSLRWARRTRSGTASPDAG